MLKLMKIKGKTWLFNIGYSSEYDEWKIALQWGGVWQVYSAWVSPENAIKYPWFEWKYRCSIGFRMKRFWLGHSGSCIKYPKTFIRYSECSS